MGLSRLGNAALSLLLVAVGALAWWLQLQPALVPDPSALVHLPPRIGAWESLDIPLDPSVESILRADFNLQRVYQDPAGRIVWVYLGYYGTRRGGRPEHTPRGCYTGAGWGIEHTRTLVADAGSELRVNEYRVERDGERRLVQFWYRSHRRTGMLGGLDQNVDRLLGRLLEGRADGALLRISTPLATLDDEVSARSLLLSFASALDAEVGARWPTERAARDVAPTGGDPAANRVAGAVGR